MSDAADKKNSLLIVLTGDGKGKTTSALGQAFRALGHGFRVCLIQFIKGGWAYGELNTAKQFEGLLDIHVMGRGFTWKSENIDKDIAIAKEGWELAKKVIHEGKHRLVILDELTYLLTYNMIDEQEVIDTLQSRPADMHVVVTGRGASKNLIETADLVTEMVAVKHPYDNGVKAQKGIEF